MIEGQALIKLNKDLSKIGEDLFKAAIAVPDAITRRLAIGANDIRNTIIMSMRETPKTGRIYKRKSVRHISSSPGNPPAIDTGELVRSIIFDVKPFEIEVGSEGGAPYAEALEYGAEYKDGHKMAARPWLAPAVDKHEKEIINDVGKTAFELVKKPFKGK